MKSYKIKNKLVQSSSTIFTKGFIKKSDLNLAYSRLEFLLKEKNYPDLLCISQDIEIKKFLYIFLKLLKASKAQILKQEINLPFKNFGMKLQSSMLYTSSVEHSKKEKLRVLKSKINFYQRLLISNKMHFFPWSYRSQEKNPKDIMFYSSLKAFSGVLNKANKIDSYKKTRILRFLKSRKFFEKLMESRFCLFVSSGKKRYRKISFDVSRNRKKLRRLFLFHDLSEKNYETVKKRNYKKFKTLIWKRKNRLKWKKSKLRRFLGFRKRISFNFYIPNHFEMNLKTLNAVYLGYTDYKSINMRIPFWLGLRKLITFLSA